MSNMNYCTFENTSKDMAQALDKLESVLDGNDSDMSKYELDGSHRLVNLAATITARVAEASLDSPRLISPLTPESIAVAKCVKTLANSLESEMLLIFWDTIREAVSRGQQMNNDYEAELAANEANTEQE